MLPRLPVLVTVRAFDTPTATESVGSDVSTLRKIRALPFDVFPTVVFSHDVFLFLLS